MASVAQTITTWFDHELRRRLPNALMQKGALAMAREAVQIMRDRCNEGIDVNGRRFAKFTARYEAHKRRFIKSGGGGSKYAAKGLPNHMRLSGALFDDMDAQVLQAAQFTNHRVTSSIRLFVRSRSVKKAMGLMSDTGIVKTKRGSKSYRKASRMFFGLSKQPARRAKEEARLARAFEQATGLKFTSRGARIR